jgi:hypothetical protein
MRSVTWSISARVTGLALCVCERLCVYVCVYVCVCIRPVIRGIVVGVTGSRSSAHHENLCIQNMVCVVYNQHTIQIYGE